MKQRLLMLFLCAVLYSNCFAWGANGHRIVGEIADSYLTKKARKAIAGILGTESIAMSSNWADFIKSDTSMKYLDNWHYINFAPGLAYDAFAEHLKKDTTTNAYTKLNFLINELKKKDITAERKLFCLRMIIHIEGDIHQPMHVGKAEDLGGNRIKLFWFNDVTNLHAVWDEKIIEQQKLSYTEYASAINHTSKQQRQVWQQQPMEQWLFESYQLSSKLYSSITQPEQRLGYRYSYDYLSTVNEQLLKAGVRLAGLLNEIFG